jgi:nucleoside-diphosphate-sugar epimerase
MAKTVAITGATGFVGRHLVERTGGEDWRVRTLSRRAPLDGTETITGDLANASALARLVAGADHVVHLAGLVKSPKRDAFAAVNVAGTEHLARAMGPGTAQLLLVSSLAARHPEVSAYAASKRAAEDAALRILGPERVTIIRPPAIYGPGDRATLVIFRQLAGRLLVAPGPRGARFSLLYVGDLVQLILGHLRGEATLPRRLEPDDGRPGGYGWGDIAAIAGKTLGRRVRTIRVPVRLLRQPARMADVLAARFGLGLPLTTDKLGELAHHDWVAGGPALPKPMPDITFEQGFPRTLEWYRQAGWL